MSNQLVTVYITTKNRRQLLQRALQSVLGQTYKSIEIIVVNDASTDETEQFLTECSARYENVKVLNLRESKGAPNARNLAISEASGKYITGLDDDDYFLPFRIEHLVQHYDSNYAFVCTGYYWDYGKYKKKIYNSSKVIDIKQQLHRNLASNQVLVETERLRFSGGFDTSFVACQDWELWTRLILEYGPALRIKSLDYVIDVSHGNHRITDNPSRVKGFEQYLSKYRDKMSNSHKKSLAFHIASAQKRKLSFIELCQLATVPLWRLNFKYWVRTRFPSITRFRLKIMQ